MKPTSTLSVLFGLALLVGLGYALWILGRWGVGVAAGASPELQTGAAAALVLLACAAMVANGLHAIARRDGTRERRGLRGAVYEHALRARAADGAPYGNAEFPADAAAAHQQMLLHASPAVLGAYLRLRRADEAGVDTTEELVDLVRAMRRDLGQRGPDLGVAELGELIDPSAPAPPLHAGDGARARG